MTAMECTKKHDARAKLLFCLSKLMSFLPFSLPSSSSLLKLPLTKPRRRRQRERQNAIGLGSKTTTLQVHHAFLYIALPSLRDYDVKWPNYKFTVERERQGDKFNHLCLNSGAVPSLSPNPTRRDKVKRSYFRVPSTYASSYYLRAWNRLRKTILVTRRFGGKSTTGERNEVRRYA